MRKALIGSFVFHVVLTVGLFYWVAFSQVKYVPRDVYTVRLVGSVPQARAAAPQVQTAPPKPVEEKKVEEEEKKDQMPAPPDKPKPRAKPQEKKEKSVPTTDITKTDAKPDTGLAQGEGIPGPPGDSPSMGSVSIDGAEFPFASYINRMRQKIAMTWDVPAGTEGFERGAVVYFRIHRDGSVSNVNVEKSSTLPLFDRSCQRAVLEAAPMPPLPREYSNEFIGVHFTFVYQPPSQ